MLGWREGRILDGEVNFFTDVGFNGVQIRLCIDTTRATVALTTFAINNISIGPLEHSVDVRSLDIKIYPVIPCFLSDLRG